MVYINFFKLIQLHNYTIQLVSSYFMNYNRKFKTFSYEHLVSEYKNLHSLKVFLEQIKYRLNKN